MNNELISAMIADPNDIVWGRKGIVEVLNMNMPRVDYLVREGRLPVHRFGDRIVASRRALLAAVFGEAA